MDQILCAGDLVEKGDDGDAVVKLIHEREIPCVQGNHDEMAYGNVQYLREYGDPNHPAMQKHLLTDETLQFCMKLPPTRRYQFGELSLLLAHGSPTRNSQYVYATNPVHVLFQVAQSAGTDLLVLGHTHQPMWCKIGSRWLFNPGSTNRWEGGTCAILELPSLKYEVFNTETGKPIRPETKLYES